jgi:SNF2 family DNA or RNA helicase
MDLRVHQLAALEFINPRDGSLCCIGMGAGKTAVAIAVADNLPANRMLVLCPPTCRAVWRGQLRKHCARDIEAVILDKGTIKQRTALADDACHKDKPCVIVANYEAALYEPFKTWALDRRWDLVVLDESQKVMGVSKTALFANALRERSGKRICLSGTPLTQDPLSVWAQARFADPSAFGQNFKSFRNHFENKRAIYFRKALTQFNEALMQPCLDPYRGDHKPIAAPPWLQCGVLHQKEYLRRLAGIAYRCENLDLDLPSMTVEKRTYELSDAAKYCHNRFSTGNQYEIESGNWEPIRRSYSVVMRLQQITSGWFPAKDTHKPIHFDHGKEELLEELLDEAAGEPVVVFTRFVFDLDIVQKAAKRLRRKYGEISARRKDGLSDCGTMPDGLQVVGVQEQAGGAGIDLSRARIAIFYSLSWSRADYNQAVARVYRPPQTRPVMIYQLVGERSIDEELYLAIAARTEMIQEAWSRIETASSASPWPARSMAGY